MSLKWLQVGPLSTPTWEKILIHTFMNIGVICYFYEMQRQQNIHFLLKCTVGVKSMNFVDDFLPECHKRIENVAKQTWTKAGISNGRIRILGVINSQKYDPVSSFSWLIILLFCSTAEFHARNYSKPGIMSGWKCAYTKVLPKPHITRTNQRTFLSCAYFYSIRTSSEVITVELEKIVFTAILSAIRVTKQQSNEITTKAHVLALITSDKFAPSNHHAVLVVTNAQSALLWECLINCRKTIALVLHYLQWRAKV